MDLSDAYANATYIKDAEAYPERWADAARSFREVEHAVGRAILNQPYGDTERQQYDLFLPAGRPAGVMIFVHGGYWRRFHRRDWSHFAAGAQAHQIAVAMLSYDLAPDVRVSQITRQVAVAVETISQRVAGPIYLAGHSAGGHLVSRMLCPDVPLSMRGRIARVMPISPVADLRPLLRTDLNEDLKLDETEAAAESPILSKQMGATPVHVWVGSDERPAFIDQARWLQDAWQTELTLDPGKHHFNVIDGLLTSDSALMTALLSP